MDAITEVLVRDGEKLKLRTRTIHVEVLSGPNARQVVDLVGPEVRVGTGKNAHLVLFDNAVSRHHLTLKIEAAGIRVVDAGSRNGTLLDGVRVVDAYARPDSLVAIGNTTFRIRASEGVVDLPLSNREQFGGLVGKSAAMRQVFTLLEKIAGAREPVLVTGETGTGKELVAEAIHDESDRSEGPFVVFDCSAVTASLMESELFGHVRGSFTGAHADREGAFEAADGGTLFLDEIGELPLDLQPKLLRALERLEVRRVGSNTPRTVDVRIVAATNRDLESEVAARRFREDLFYRLAVIRVELPPLRARGDDAALLIDHFVRLASQRGTKATLDPAARASLAAGAWPGNVRELKNAVARALTLGMPESIRPSAPVSTNEALPIDLSLPFMDAREAWTEKFERAYLTEALRRCDGNATKAAELAGVNRKLMQRAIKRYDLRALLKSGT
ncbi:MAG TPA: sigma 54-interacting transcriptional regulator [Polyangiaceae bacterium]